MKIAKDGIRSIVKVGYDGRVYKTFRGTDRDKRFANEVRVLNILEARCCEWVPRLLENDPETLTIVTTNCGAPAENTISEGKAAELFKKLVDDYGVLHTDPFPRNITYNSRSGQFCIIDFELAEVKEDPQHRGEEEEAHRSLSWSGATRSGRRKEVNEDALSVFSSEGGWAKNEELESEHSIDENGVIFAVSDGMGGQSGGEVASDLVVRELRRFLPAMMGDFQSAADPEDLLESAVRSLHDYVTRTGDNSTKLEGMGATVVCGLFYRTRVFFAHVGDSRFYRFRDGELTQLTHDHSHVGSLFRSGKIKEREMRTHPRRNILNQAIGGGCHRVFPQVESASLEPGDWYLICSDGVIDGLWNKNIEHIFSEAVEDGWSPAKAQEAILDRAYAEAGGDDTTLFVIRADSSEGDHSGESS